MTRLSIHLLGAPRIKLGDQAAVLDTRKAVALLAYLAVTGQRHTRDTVVALLWPEYDQKRGRAALRRTLSTLKSAVSGQGLAIERETLGLNWSSDVWVDLVRFRELLDLRKEHGHSLNETCPACLAPLTEAVELYSGDFMSGFSLRDSPPFDDWTYLQGEALRRDLSGALQGIMRCLQMEKRFGEAVEYGTRLLDLDPLHEPAHRQMMTLLSLDGQRAAALQHYRDCVRILENELGVPPLAETTGLYEDILSGRFPDSSELSSVSSPLAVEAPSPVRDVSQESQSLRELPLVGRSQEMRTLVELYRDVGPEGRLQVLVGEAGIGKTRLAGAFLDFVRSKAGEILSAQCYEGEQRLAYAPIVEALSSFVQSTDKEWREDIPDAILAEAARLFPELLLPSLVSQPPPPLESAGAQQRFFEALAQLLVAACGSQPPGVLFIDDVQWADDATISFLNYLIRRLRSWPILILVSCRSELLAADHPLHSMFTYVQRERFGGQLQLARLDKAAVTQLIGAASTFADVGLHLEAALDSEIARRLMDETEGLPYFLVEYLSLLNSQKNLQGSFEEDAHGPPSLPMPEGVRQLLRSRLMSVGEVARQILGTGAVIGRSFELDLLQETSGRNEEETVSALDNLLDRGLLIERAAGPQDSPNGAGSTAPQRTRYGEEPVYDFNHEKMRSYVYEDMSLARRRLLHKRVAEALSRGRSRLGSSPAAQTAKHFQLAGMEQEAGAYFKIAGDEARALFANAEALSHYKSALALGYARTAELNEAIGDLLTLQGDYKQALLSYELAASDIVPEEDPQALAQVEMKLGQVHHRRGEWILASGHYQRAYELMADDGRKARLLTDWSLTTHQSGDSQQALELAEDAVNLASPVDDQRALAQAYNILGILANSQGEWQLANQHLECSLYLAQALNEPGMIIAALNNLSTARRYAGELAQAVELVMQALALCQEVGDRHREAALQNNLADLYHLSGQSEESMAHLKKAVAIYAEIGGEPGEWQPEIWKLTEW